MTTPRLLVHHGTDKVGCVVVEGVGEGQSLVGVVIDGDQDFTIEAKADTPMGRKIAFADLEVGSDAVKYGHVIGRIVERVNRGGHVHVHNLKTKPW
jgi:(2R)-sulfolactate sulfo-lyase subunit alpha